jgi:hypothetical protein
MLSWDEPVCMCHSRIRAMERSNVVEMTLALAILSSSLLVGFEDWVLNKSQQDAWLGIDHHGPSSQGMN